MKNRGGKSRDALPLILRHLVEDDQVGVVNSDDLLDGDIVDGDEAVAIL